MLNKRGQESPVGLGFIIGAAIVIIAAIFIVIGFTQGWGKILPWLSPTNVDTVVTQCQVACTTNSQYGFCTQNRTVNDGTNPQFSSTCYQLATNSAYISKGYGISACPQVQC